VHEGIVAESKAMMSALDQAGNAATSDIPVLLEGETGTGKDLLAHFIHKKSARAAKPFVVVNCSTLQKDLIESELFGHRKGSFTGAVGHHTGLFVQAEGGTLFLDEIGELDSGLQSKLLRVLEARKIRPVGSATEESVDVRIVCASNRRRLPGVGRLRSARRHVLRVRGLILRLNQSRHGQVSWTVLRGLPGRSGQLG
jgi:two-component system response regulator GlrR